MSLLRTLYHRYLSLALPWRRHILAGTDLTNQNTYWIFRAPGTIRPRRIALPYMPKPFSRLGFAHVHPRHLEGMDIPVQWVQWLKGTRQVAPTIEELREDVGRRERLKVLVGQIEERWSAQGVKAVLGQNVTERLQITEVVKSGSREEDPSRRVVTSEEVLGTPAEAVTPRTEKAEEVEKTESPWKEASKTKDEPIAWTPRLRKR